MIPEWQPVEEPRIPKAVWYVVPVVVIGTGLGGYLYYTKNKAPPPEPVVKAAPLPPAAEPAPPAAFCGSRIFGLRPTTSQFSTIVVRAR